jgi:tRNA(Ile)-lysidine synthase
VTGQRLLERVRETIRRRGMLGGGETVVVATSGGRDSTALLHALAALREELRLSLHVAHFNHGLRSDAGDDAAFVAAMSRTLGLPYHEGAGDTRAYAEREHLSLEDAARRLRYGFLLDVSRSAAAQAAATGHTRDDQAETVLMRLLRGGGLRGLAGIPPVRMLDGVRVIRPLIDAPRAEVAAYLRDRGLAFRDDPTNRDPAILRNRLRMVVLPAIEGHNPDVRRRLARLADLLRDEAEALDLLAAPRIAEVLGDTPDGVRITLDSFGRLPASLQRRALREAVRRVRGNQDAVSFVHLEGARRLTLEGQPGAVLELPGGVRIRRLSGSVDVAVAECRGEGGHAVYRLQVPGSIIAPEFGIQVIASAVDRAEPKASSRASAATTEEITVDGVRAGPVLVVRGPRPGDRFAPLGMGGRTKKLSDYLSETNVPRHRRRLVPVLTTAEGEVLWVVGMRAAETAQPGPGTTCVVKITARKLRA